MKHYKRIILIVFIVIVTILWGISVYDINKRFPQAEEEVYHDGEWMECNGLMIRGINKPELFTAVP